MDNRIRVAFVPLKSTFIGLPRAFLFNMLFRDSYGGKIVLRIDDTDELRAQPERLIMVFDTLHWLGINWDEGPDIGGPYEPYIQTERKKTYIQTANYLLNHKKAYKCFCQNTEGIRGCTGKCSEYTSGEVDKRVAEGQKYCIRYKINNGIESYYDLIHGEIHKELKEISDPVIIRTDGTPTFHLATAVDEGALKITHIIRGVDHIESAFIQRQIMNDLGIPLPQYMHFSIYESKGTNIYEDNLKGKYDVECLRKDGFLSGAIVNFLITSGYMAKEVEDCSLYRYQDFLKTFNIENFSHSNQCYDFERLVSINKKWLKNYSENEYLYEVDDYFKFIGYTCRASKALLLALKAHVDTLNDLVRKIDVLYDCSDITIRLIATEIGDDITVLENILKGLERCDIWNQACLKNVILENAQLFGKKRCYETLRIALTNKEPFGSILEITESLGRIETINKLNKLLNYKWEIEG